MSELPLNQVLCGDCVEVLKGFPEDSVDLVVTDPPYGLSFMGKDWDKFDIHDLSKEAGKFGTGGKISSLPRLKTRTLMNYLKPRFLEMLRVLKPGALAFVMSSPRQDVLWRMLAMLEGVGFELKQSFMSWIYKTGFPKAYDVSKGIDSKLGKKRRVTGIRSYARPGGNIDNFNGSKNPNKRLVSEPASDMAKKWDGWKSQTELKPALECVLMVNKPRSESTIVDNVLRWGTGAINVDACRIPFSPGDVGDRPPRSPTGIVGGWKDWSKSSFEESNKGRFPANLLVSDGAIDDGIITGSGKYKPSSGGNSQPLNPEHGWNKSSMTRDGKIAPDDYGDIGGKSRYFDLDAWAKHHGFLDVSKPTKSERDFGLNQLDGNLFEIVEREIIIKTCKFCGKKKDMPFDPCLCDEPTWIEKKTIRKTRRKKTLNTHPTVKPIKLMAYLIELGCPLDGVVLDPFVGSGTTCIAAKRLRRRYIGIEINSEYVETARARIIAYPSFSLDGEM